MPANFGIAVDMHLILVAQIALIFPISQSDYDLPLKIMTTIMITIMITTSKSTTLPDTLRPKLLNLLIFYHILADNK